VAASPDQLTVPGANFGTVAANLLAFVNEKPATIISISDTSVVINIAQVPPGENVVQLVKILPEGHLPGNKKPFIRPVLAPLFASFNGSSTDTSITFNWQNAPYVNTVEIELRDDGGFSVRPLQKIVGNSFTYNDLQANSSYTIKVTSIYPNLPSPTPTDYEFRTKADGVNNIPSIQLTGAGIATGTIFGFEVVGNTAYIAFDDDGLLTIQSFNLTTNTLNTTFSQIIVSSSPAHQSLAANSNGVYLTYLDSMPYVAAYPTILGAPDLAKPSSDFGISSTADMMTVRSLNNRIFLAARQTGDVELRELTPALVATATYTGATTQTGTSGKTVDLAYDSLTNNLYLINTDMTDNPVRAFTGMNIESTTTIVGRIPNSIDPILHFSVSNNKYFVSGLPSTDPSGYIIEGNSSYIRNLSYPISPASFGHDKQYRIWIRNHSSSSGDYFMQIDTNQNVQQTLKIFNASAISFECPVIRMDPSTGMVYMLHFNAANQLAIYKYNSNY
jgi:hypothetical protein